MSKFMYKGKTALVTGANRGIGEAFTRTLIKLGVRKIYAAVRDVSNLSPLLKEFPDIIDPVLLDVTNVEQVNKLASTIGPLDILINNAGIVSAMHFDSENALEVTRGEMETNFFAPVRLTIALLPVLKQSQEAAIINVCSIAAISNLSSIGPYSASKAALHSFTQGLRADLEKDSIRVIGVYPGPINTRMAEAWEMDKPEPAEVATKTFDVLVEGGIDVMPDDFSQHMYAEFLKHPHELEKAFAQMK